MTDGKKIKSFTDLTAWQKAHRLSLLIYQETEIFPLQEKFSLTSQIRRAAISITSNIAEGFSRKSEKEKIQFYHLSLGSLTELENQCIFAKDAGYFDDKRYQETQELITEVNKLIHGLIRFLRTT